MIKLLVLLNIFLLSNAQNITNDELFKISIFQEHLISDIILTILVFIISIITTIGGVGGGGLLIPTYMFLGNFSLRQTMALSVMTICGDTLVRIIFLFKKKHSLSDKRYLINYIPLLLIVPFDSNFSFIGVILNNIIPKIITIVLIIVVLLITIIKSMVKGVKKFKKESKMTEKDIEMTVIDNIGNPVSKSNIIDNRKADKLINQVKLFFILLGIFLILSIFSITRIFFEICDYKYWIHLSGQLLCIGIISIGIISYIKNDYKKKKENNFLFLKGDIVWKNKNIIKFVTIGSITGIISSYMGIGGGMLITPIMIDVGMIPEVVIATGSIGTFFSSAISTINYAVYGELIYDYGIVFFVTSGVGSVIGVKITDLIVEKCKRQSILIFIISLIIFLSMILLTINSILDPNILNLRFNQICNFSN